MSTQTFDPVRYKEAQRADWSDTAAAWRKWWETVERSVGVVSERLVELAEIKQGERVLDIATGIGEPAVPAAQRVGPKGRVVATDIAPGMLELGRERAAEQGLDNIEFREADAEELELPDERFDVVLSRFGLMFFPDLDTALARIRDALAQGGRFAAAVWGSPERVPFIALAMQTAMKELEVPPPPPGTPGPLTLGDAEALEARLRDAGFDEVRSERITLEIEYPSADEYAEFITDIAAPIKNMLADKPKEREQAVRTAISHAAEAYAADGVVRIPGDVIFVFGRR